MGSAAGGQSWGYTCYLWLIERQRYMMMHAQYPLPVYYSQVCMSVCFEVISEYSHPTSVSLKFPFMTILCLTTLFCACVCSQTLLDDVQRQLQNKEKMLQRLTRSLQEKDKQLRDVMDLTKDEVSSSYQLQCHSGWNLKVLFGPLSLVSRAGTRRWSSSFKPYHQSSNYFNPLTLRVSLEGNVCSSLTLEKNF